MPNEKLADRLKSIHQSSIRKIFESAPPDAINMGLGELQFPTPQIIRDQTTDLLKEEYIPYTPNAGDSQLRDLILQYYGKPDLSTCITVGAEEALFLAIMAYTSKGDEVLIPDPGFVAYSSIVNIAEATPVTFDLNEPDNFRIDLKSLKKKITSRTKMIILSNPSNPLGISLTDREIDFLLAISRENGVLLLIDEIYRELFHQERPLSFCGMTKNTLVVSGLSKSHCMTGWRLGWLVGNKQLIEPLIPLHQYICTCAPYLSQKAAIPALNKKGMAAKEHIRKQLYENFVYLKEKFTAEIKSLRLIQPDASPYLFFKTEETEDTVMQKLQNAGVIALPGSIFGKNSRNWIRLSYGMRKELVETAADRIIRALTS